MVAVVLAAVVGGGGAIAATKLTSPKAENDAIVADAAKRLGVDPSKLSDALKQAVAARVDAAVAAGTLTKEQGDAIKSRIDSDQAPLFASPGLERGFRHGGQRFGFGGPGDAFHVEGVLRQGVQTAADYLGLTPAKLRDELASGKSLADVAKAQSKSVDGLTQALTDAATKKLDAAVSAGRLTKDQEKTILDKLPQALDAVVNGKLPNVPGGPRFGRAFGPGFFPAVHLAGKTAADYLGLSVAELRTQLQSGKSLADVAKAQGKSVDGLKQALKDAVKTKLDEQVAAGQLSKADEQNALDKVSQTIDAVVDGQAPAFKGFGRWHDRFGGSAPFEPAPEAPATASATA
jgi:hypothetical protein